MAGRFSNTRYTNTVSSVLGSMQSLLKNNFYKFSELPPTPVEYFHLNKDASTLDEGSRLAYNSVGEDSPFWFNQIHNMMLYGINTPMEIQYSNEEFDKYAERKKGMFEWYNSLNDFLKKIEKF